MGEVYRARDTKLNRDVALKVLPDASPPIRTARPVHARSTDSRLAQSPQHRAIYGLEDAGPASALVMELVEGATLAAHRDASDLPLDEALAIARQIAEALEAAHEPASCIAI